MEETDPRRKAVQGSKVGKKVGPAPVDRAPPGPPLRASAPASGVWARSARAPAPAPVGPAPSAPVSAPVGPAPSAPISAPVVNAPSASASAGPAPRAARHVPPPLQLRAVSSRDPAETMRPAAAGTPMSSIARVRFRGSVSEQRNYENFLGDLASGASFDQYKESTLGPDKLALLRRTLGAVSGRPDYYFEQSADSVACAQAFITAFKRDPGRQRIIDEFYARKSIPHDRETAPASCLSFLTATIDGKKVCFVAISGSDDLINAEGGLRKTIIDFAESFEREGYKFIALPNESQNYNMLIAGALAHQGHRRAKSPERPCTEKTLTATMAKLYYMFGDRIKLEGASNVSFKPFPPNRFDIESGDVIMLPSVRGQAQGMRLIPCCENCQANKHAVLNIMETMREKGQAKLSAGEAAQAAITPLSPVREFTAQAREFLFEARAGSAEESVREGITVGGPGGKR